MPFDRRGAGYGGRRNLRGKSFAGDSDALVLPDASGTLQAFWRADTYSATGSSIDQLTDKTGNGRHLTSTGSARPTLVTSGGPGEQPYADFDGTNDTMASPSFSVSQPMSYMLVYKDDTWTSADRIIDGVAADRGVFNQFGGTEGHQLYAGSAFTCQANFGPGTWHTLFCEFNGASSLIRWDGGNSGGAGNPGSVGLTDGLRLGSKWGPTAWADFSFAELRVFSGALSATDRDYLGAYAEVRYGITW